MAAPTDWITLAEAAEILAAANVRFTTSTIGGWARAGRLQSIKLGGRRFVRRGEVRHAKRPADLHPRDVEVEMLGHLERQRLDRHLAQRL